MPNIRNFLSLLKNQSDQQNTNKIVTLMHGALMHENKKPDASREKIAMKNLTLATNLKTKRYEIKQQLKETSLLNPFRKIILWSKKFALTHQIKNHMTQTFHPAQTTTEKLKRWSGELTQGACGVFDIAPISIGQAFVPVALGNERALGRLALGVIVDGVMQLYGEVLENIVGSSASGPSKLSPAHNFIQLTDEMKQHNEHMQSLFQQYTLFKDKTDAQLQTQAFTFDNSVFDGKAPNNMEALQALFLEKTMLGFKNALELDATSKGRNMFFQKVLRGQREQNVVRLIFILFLIAHDPTAGLATGILKRPLFMLRLGAQLIAGAIGGIGSARAGRARHLDLPENILSKEAMQKVPDLANILPNLRGLNLNDVLEHCGFNTFQKQENSLSDKLKSSKQSFSSQASDEDLIAVSFSPPENNNELSDDESIDFNPSQKSLLSKTSRYSSKAEHLQYQAINEITTRQLYDINKIRNASSLPEYKRWELIKNLILKEKMGKCRAKSLELHEKINLLKQKITKLEVNPSSKNNSNKINQYKQAIKKYEAGLNKTQKKEQKIAKDMYLIDQITNQAKLDFASLEANVYTDNGRLKAILESKYVKDLQSTGEKTIDIDRDVKCLQKMIKLNEAQAKTQDAKKLIEIETKRNDLKPDLSLYMLSVMRQFSALNAHEVNEKVFDIKVYTEQLSFKTKKLYNKNMFSLAYQGLKHYIRQPGTFLRAISIFGFNNSLLMGILAADSISDLTSKDDQYILREADKQLYNKLFETVYINLEGNDAANTHGELMLQNILQNSLTLGLAIGTFLPNYLSMVNYFFNQLADGLKEPKSLSELRSLRNILAQQHAKLETIYNSLVMQKTDLASKNTNREILEKLDETIKNAQTYLEGSMQLFKRINLLTFESGQINEITKNIEEIAQTQALTAQQKNEKLFKELAPLTFGLANPNSPQNKVDKDSAKGDVYNFKVFIDANSNLLNEKKLDMQKRIEKTFGYKDGISIKIPDNLNSTENVFEALLNRIDELAYKQLFIGRLQGLLAEFKIRSKKGEQCILESDLESFLTNLSINGQPALNLSLNSQFDLKVDQPIHVDEFGSKQQNIKLEQDTAYVVDGLGSTYKMVSALKKAAFNAEKNFYKQPETQAQKNQPAIIRKLRKASTKIKETIKYVSWKINPRFFKEIGISIIRGAVTYPWLLYRLRQSKMARKDMKSGAMNNLDAMQHLSQKQPNLLTGEQKKHMELLEHLKQVHDATQKPKSYRQKRSNIVEALYANAL